MANSPRLALPLIADGQASAYIPHNNALSFLDAFVGMRALDSGLNTPPGSPVDGDTYILGTSPTGAWSGQASKIAIYASGWNFFTPKSGLVCLVTDESSFTYYDGSEWIDFPTNRHDYRTFTISDEFGNSTAFGNLVTRFQNGTGATTNSVEPDSTYGQNRVGLVSAGTGSTNAGRAGLGGNIVRICLGQGKIEMEWDVYVPVLSTAGERFIVAVGLGDGNASDAPANHVLLKYTDNVNSGAWYISASDNSSVSTTNGSVAAIAAATWYRVKMVINDAGTSVTFYVNEVSAGTHATNIPTASGRAVDVLGGIFKTAGTTTRLVVMDRYWMRFRRSTPI